MQRSLLTISVLLACAHSSLALTPAEFRAKAESLATRKVQQPTTNPYGNLPAFPVPSGVTISPSAGGDLVNDIFPATGTAGAGASPWVPSGKESSGNGGEQGTNNSGQVSNSIVQESTDLKLQFEKVTRLNTDTHTQLVPFYEGKRMGVKIQYDEAVEKDPGLLLQDIGLYRELSALSSYTGTFQKYTDMFSFHIFNELYQNAMAGQPRAKERLLKIRLTLASREPVHDTMEYLKTNFGPIPNEDMRIEKNWERLARQLTEAQANALAFETEQKRQFKKWADTDTKRDEYERMDEKLNDLVLKNDRSGVRHMIEAYLPWTMMAPTEIQAWQQWLEALEHPSEAHAFLAFRGVEPQNDKIQRLELPNGQTRLAFFSTILTKNQGSYTRRLRSLTTNRIKNGIATSDVVPALPMVPGAPYDPFAKGPKLPRIGPSAPITNQFMAHAGNPAASSFLSFTDDIQVALNFAKSMKFDKGTTIERNGGVLAVKIDKRRIFPNVVSFFSFEREYLVPLIVFPDEVVAYVPSTGDVELLKKNVVDAVKAKTGIDPVSYKPGDDYYKSAGNQIFGEMLILKKKSSFHSCEALF